MKNTIFIFVFIILNFSFLIHNCPCQWEPDVRLTTGSGSSNTSFNNARCVSASGANIHVVWYDDRDGNQEIYYKLSIDNGISWSSGIRLTNNSEYSRFPSIAVNNSNIHVVWEDNRDGDVEIYYKNSMNGGLSWGTDKRLTTQSGYSSTPSITVQGSTVHVVWEDSRDGNPEIYYKKSTDGGTVWGADLRLTNNSEDSNVPSITNSNSNIYVVWNDDRDGNEEIYYKQSTDGGINWGIDKRLTNNLADSYCPSIAVAGSNVYVVWLDYRDGNEEIYYKYSSNGGMIWGTETRLTNNSAESVYPSIAVSGINVHIVWHDKRDGNYEIYYKQSANGGVNWGTDIRLTNNSAHSVLSSITISGTIVHVVWTDDRNGNECIYYKRNPTGNSIGIKNISSEIPEEFALGQNYPNPFNSMTNVKFQMLNAENAKILVFDLLGREVAILVNEKLESGTYEVRFHSGDLPSGIYFYQLKTENFIETKKLIILK